MTDEPVQLGYAMPVARRGKGHRPRRSPAGEAVFVALHGLFWTVAAGLVVVGFVGVMEIVFGPVLAVYSVTLVVLIPVTAAAAAAVRRRRAAAVLAYLEQAVRLNQPLDRMLAAAAAGERGRLRGRLDHLREAITGGASVADAVTATVPEVSAAAAGRIAHGESVGRLPAALDRLVRERLRGSPEGRDDRAFAAGYPPAIVLAVLVVVTIACVYVLPKYAQIFHDFHIELPLLTRWLMGSADAWGWVLWVVVVVVLARTGATLRRARGGQPTWLFRGPIDWLRWHVPVWRTPYRDRSVADWCDAIADGVEQGMPLGTAVERAAALDLNRVLARRAADWAGRMASGLDPALAARAAGLPAVVAGLVSAGSAGDVAAALRFAAKFYAGRSDARRAAIAAVYVPLVTLLLGVLVAVVALAMFLPLRDLIDRSNPYPVGL